MKKFRVLPPCLAAALCLASCNALEPSAPAEPEVEAAFDEQALYTSEIDVKFSEEMAASIESDFKAGKVYTKSMPFNELVDELGIVSVRRIFEDDERYLGRQHRAGLHLWYRLTLSGSSDRPMTRAADDIASIPGVVEAEPCRKVKLFGFNDPYFPRQWGLHQDSGIDINVEEVWDNYTCGSNDVIVAVVDQGVGTGHEDLPTVIPAGAGGSRDFVGNSYMIVPGDHGYHVSGVIAASNNNGIGVCGIAGGDAAAGIPGVKILSCQIFIGDLGSHYDADAIRYAADNGAVICQNSWGNYYDMNEDGVVSGSELDVAKRDEISSSLKAAVDYFIDYAGCDDDGNQLPDSPMKGGVVFFASGNENIPYGVPASYERVIAVGSVDRTGARSGFSNYGDWVDICAPGSDVFSSIAEGYGSMSGTSMACPHVSGVAALLVSYFGGAGFTNEMLLDRLLGGADGSLASSRQVGPFLDALGAFTYGGTVAPERVDDYDVNAVSNSIVFDWKVTPDADDDKAYGYLLLASRDRAQLENIDPRNIPSSVSRSVALVGDAAVGDALSASIDGLEFSADYYTCIIGYDYQNNYSEPSDIASVTTGANSAPVITASESGPAEIHSFETFTRTYTVSDPDGHGFSVDFVPGSDAARLSQNSSGDYVLTITGNAVEAGLYKAELTATDSYGASTSESLEYRILENHAPVVAGEPENVLLTSIGEVVEIDVTKLVTDPDGERLAWTVSGSNQKAVHLSVSGDVLYVTALGYGGSEIMLTGTDSRSENCSVTFSVLVKDPASALELYPNPVSDYLNVRTLDLEDTHIVISSPTGAELYDDTLPVGAFEPAQIDMRGFAPGQYRVRVSFGGEQYDRIVVKL